MDDILHQLYKSNEKVYPIVMTVYSKGLGGRTVKYMLDGRSLYN